MRAQLPARAELWARLGTRHDLLVIGGGITGAGIARDATMRGLRVALVEKNDLAWGTSSRSSKLIHGGFRYLQHYEFGLVFESVSERHLLGTRVAPHLVQPMPFLFPVYRKARVGLTTLRAGMWLYDGLSLFRAPALHKTLQPSRVFELEPKLRRDGLRGGLLYYDCATDDARLTLETALDAAIRGATIGTWTEVEGLLHRRNGRVGGAAVRDVLTGREQEVVADVVVQATGPWTDRAFGSGADAGDAPLLRPTRGVHITLDQSRLPVRHAVVLYHPEDERLLFAVPWGDRTYVGTTDTDYDGDPDDVTTTRDDVNYLLEACRACFPACELTAADVVSTWAALRPLLRPASEGGAVRESDVSREHEILVRDDGLVTIAGGKLTTYRRMARQVVDVAVDSAPGDAHLHRALCRHSNTTAPLPGAVGFHAMGGAEGIARRAQAVAPALGPESALHLARTYGSAALDIAKICAEHPTTASPLVAGRPDVTAEVDWAVEHELATRASDVLVRRTQLFFKDKEQGMGAAERVIARMAAHLGWDDHRCVDELEAFRSIVAGSRAWRTEGAERRSSYPPRPRPGEM